MKKLSGDGKASSSLRPMSAYSALDPDFRGAALEARLANLFIRLQQCRCPGS